MSKNWLVVLGFLSFTLSSMARANSPYSADGTTDGLVVGQSRIGIPETILVTPIDAHPSLSRHECYLYFAHGYLTLEELKKPEHAGPEIAVVRYHLDKEEDMHNRPGYCEDGIEIEMERPKVADFKKRWDSYEAGVIRKETEIKEIAEKRYKGPSTITFPDKKTIHVGDVLATNKLPDNDQRYELVYPDVITWKANPHSSTSNVYMSHAGERFRKGDFENGEFVIEGFSDKSNSGGYRMAVVKYLDDYGRIDDAPIGGYFLVPIWDLKGAEPPGHLRRMGRALHLND